MNEYLLWRPLGVRRIFKLILALRKKLRILEHPKLYTKEKLDSVDSVQEEYWF